MKLRNLIELVGIIVLAWPIQAHAQPSVGTRRIGVLMYLEETDPQSKIYLDAFVQTLQKLGWTVGRNLRIDYRWTGGDAERVRKYAAELVALAPDVILAAGGRMLSRSSGQHTPSPLYSFRSLTPSAADLLKSR
jgi:putative ABC transport system substrate-binding protein